MPCLSAPPQNLEQRRKTQERIHLIKQKDIFGTTQRGAGGFGSTDKY